jgi:phage head maturation protease
MTKVLCRGFCVPFNQPRYIEHEGLIEILDSNCFADFLATGKQVPVLTAHQHGRQIAITSQLFATPDGLAFSFDCDLADDALLGIVSGRRSGASIFFATRQTKCEIIYEVEHQMVVSASLAHIALSDCPSYHGTKVWRADEDANLAAAPQVILDFDARWVTSFERIELQQQMQTLSPEQIAATGPQMRELNPLMRHLLHHPAAMTKQTRGRLRAVLQGSDIWKKNAK